MGKLNKRRVLQVVAAAVTGGVLLQAAGCATTIAPLALSLFENIALSRLFGGLGGLL